MDGSIRITPATVTETHRWMRDQHRTQVPLINEVRAGLASKFETEVAPISAGQYRRTIDAVFTDGDRAVNVSALVRLLGQLDVPADYPGFIVDEVLGRELASAIAGGQPLRTLAEATFHYADIGHHRPDQPAGVDDLEAAIAAGVQTRLPGWDWQTTPGGLPGDGNA